MIDVNCRWDGVKGMWNYEIHIHNVVVYTVIVTGHGSGGRSRENKIHGLLPNVATDGHARQLTEKTNWE